MPITFTSRKGFTYFLCRGVTKLAVSGDYAHGESRSCFWGFIDDTELYLDDEAKLIYVRAAARLDGEDFSINGDRSLGIHDRFLVLSQR